MELFEKLNAFAKTAADKTNELVEDTRLKTQIRQVFYQLVYCCPWSFFLKQ